MCDDMNVGLLKTAIRRSGYSVRDLATYVGMSESAFSSRINGKIDFRIREVKELYYRLHLTQEQLFDIFFMEE